MYWRQRQQQLYSQLEKDETRLKKRLSAFYDTESRKLEKQILAFYQQYGKNNIIEYRLLMETLQYEDRTLLIQKINDFIQKYPQYSHLVPVRESIYKLNRLEGLQASIKMQQLQIGAVNEEELKKHLEKQVKRNVTAAAEQMGFGGNFYAENPEIVKKFVGTAWADGKNFSQRIWGNTEKLANYLSDDVAVALARGDSCQRIIRNMTGRFGKVARNDMYRLIYSEDTFVMAESSIGAFEDDFEEYRLSTADSDACPICKKIEKQTFLIKDRKAGVNFPPLHPWCRCSFTIVVNNRREWIKNYVKKHGGDEKQAIKIQEQIGGKE